MPHVEACRFPPKVALSECLLWRPRPCARDLSLVVWLSSTDAVLQVVNHNNSRPRRPAGAINDRLRAVRGGLPQAEASAAVGGSGMVLVRGVTSHQQGAAFVIRRGLTQAAK